MRPRLLLAGLALTAFGLGSCAPARSPVSRQEARPALARAASPSPQRVDFNAQVRPLLEGRCQPCHFAGGKMYEQLPFDRPETIHTLGEKLFTRIRDEREQALLRSFLAQEPESRSGGGGVGLPEKRSPTERSQYFRQ